MNNWKELICVVLAAGVVFLTGAAGLGSRSAAEKTQACVANLKAVQQLSVMYQQDHDGAFPPVITRTKPSWTYWYFNLLPYAKQPSVLYCPGNSKAYKALAVDEGEKDLLPPTFDQAAVSYGMNFCLSSSGDPKSSPRPGNVKLIADPAYTIFFGDSKGASLRPTKWCWKDDYQPIHEGAANFVFIDGHVELMNEKNLGTLSDFEQWEKDTKRWENWK